MTSFTDLKDLDSTATALEAVGRSAGWLKHIRPMCEKAIKDGLTQYRNLRQGTDADFEQARGAVVLAERLIDLVEKTPIAFRKTLEKDVA